MREVTSLGVVDEALDALESSIADAVVDRAQELAARNDPCPQGETFQVSPSQSLSRNVC